MLQKDGFSEAILCFKPKTTLKQSFFQGFPNTEMIGVGMHAQEPKGFYFSRTKDISTKREIVQVHLRVSRFLTWIVVLFRIQEEFRVKTMGLITGDAQLSCG